MSDAAEVAIVLLLLSMALSQCGTCRKLERIADHLERSTPVQAIDAGAAP